VLPWVIGIAVLALAATVGWWAWKNNQDKAAFKASDEYIAALETRANNDGTRAFGMFGDVAKNGTPVYRTLALMQQGGMRMEAKDTAGAVKFFDEAGEAAPDPVLGDLARLKSALALLDTAPYAELEKRLTPLTKDGAPYRMQAKEALAFAKLMAGKSADARGDFAVLSLSPDSSDDMRDRARLAMDMIDSGSAKALPAIVKAAAVLPPPPPQLQTQPQAQSAQPGAAQ
jgi:hypothetical protein